MVNLETALSGFDAVAPRAPKNVRVAFAASFNTTEMQQIRRDKNTLAQFLGQCSHESGGFRTFEENLNYSAKALYRVFRRYFPTIELAEEYARKPQLIANRVYNDSNRINKLGNTQENDGWSFRGSGILQITGRYNAEARAKSLEMCPIEYMQKLRDDPAFSIRESARWFVAHVLPRWDGTTYHATRLINGGTIGLAHREKMVDKAFEAMNSKLELPHSLTVRQVQTLLNLRGYNAGPIDGINGNKTKNALKEFQKSKGLIPDGIVGSKTIAAFYR